MLLLSSFRKNKSGNVAVAFAIGLVPMLGLLGAAIDYQRASSARVHLQAVVDAAALAGMVQNTTDRSERIATARRMVNGSILDPDPARAAEQMKTFKLDVSMPNDVLTVRASDIIETNLVKLLGFDKVEISAAASAIMDRSRLQICVLALAKSTPHALTIAENASFKAERCAVQSNSTTPDALSIAQSAVAKADGFCSSGGFRAPTSTSPEPRGNCPQAADPYADLRVARSESCEGVQTRIVVPPDWSGRLPPGTYCNGLVILGRVTLSPGLYIIKDGPLLIDKGAKIDGEDVTFYLTGKRATFVIDGGEMAVSATRNGDYRGLLIVQDARSSIGGMSSLSGGAKTILKGVIYAPTQHVTIVGTDTFGVNTPFMPVIADTVMLSGTLGTRAEAATISLIDPLPAAAIGARLIN